MTQPDSKLERLLSQRSFGTLGELCNLGDRRFRLRVCPQLFHIRSCIFAAQDSFLRFFSHSVLLIFGIALLAQISGPPTPTWSTFRIASVGRLVTIQIREAASPPFNFRGGCWPVGRRHPTNSNLKCLCQEQQFSASNKQPLSNPPRDSHASDLDDVRRTGEHAGLHRGRSA